MIAGLAVELGGAVVIAGEPVVLINRAPDLMKVALEIASSSSAKCFVQIRVVKSYDRSSVFIKNVQICVAISLSSLPNLADSVTNVCSSTQVAPRARRPPRRRRQTASYCPLLDTAEQPLRPQQDHRDEDQKRKSAAILR